MGESTNPIQWRTLHDPHGSSFHIVDSFVQPESTMAAAGSCSQQRINTFCVWVCVRRRAQSNKNDLVDLFILFDLLFNCYWLNSSFYVLYFSVSLLFHLVLFLYRPLSPPDRMHTHTHFAGAMPRFSIAAAAVNSMAQYLSQSQNGQLKGHSGPLVDRSHLYWPGLQGLVTNPMAWRDRLTSSSK